MNSRIHFFRMSVDLSYNWRYYFTAINIGGMIKALITLSTYSMWILVLKSHCRNHSLEDKINISKITKISQIISSICSANHFEAWVSYLLINKVTCDNKGRLLMEWISVFFIETGEKLNIFSGKTCLQLRWWSLPAVKRTEENTYFWVVVLINSDVHTWLTITAIMEQAETYLSGGNPQKKKKTFQNINAAL